MATITIQTCDRCGTDAGIAATVNGDDAPLDLCGSCFSQLLAWIRKGHKKAKPR